MCTIARGSPVVVVARRSNASCRRGAPPISVRAARGRSVQRLEQSALDVACLWNREQLGVIDWLSANFAQHHPSPAVGRRGFEHLEKEWLGEMEGAARGEQQSAAGEEPHRA